MNPILLDTHAALWAADGRLKGEASKAVESASGRGELLLSPITACEIGMLVARKRLQIKTTVADYVRFLFDREGVVVATLTPRQEHRRVRPRNTSHSLHRLLTRRDIGTAGAPRNVAQPHFV